MKRYETFTIIDSDVSEDNRNQLLDRLKEVISDQQGTLVLVDEWGSRKLAYEIKKKSRGYYVRLDYCGDGALVDELERLFRIDDRVLKYMTVQLSDSVDMEQIQEEIAKAAAAEAAKAAAQKEKAAPPDTPETATQEKPDEAPDAPESPETDTQEKPEETPAASETSDTEAQEKTDEESTDSDEPEAQTEAQEETQPETKKEESE